MSKERKKPDPIYNILLERRELTADEQREALDEILKSDIDFTVDPAAKPRVSDELLASRFNARPLSDTTRVHITTKRAAQTPRFYSGNEGTYDIVDETQFNADEKADACPQCAGTRQVTLGFGDDRLVPCPKCQSTAPFTCPPGGIVDQFSQKKPATPVPEPDWEGIAASAAENRRAEKDKEIEGLNDAYIVQAERAEKAEKERDALKVEVERLKMELANASGRLQKIKQLDAIVDVRKAEVERLTATLKHYDDMREENDNLNEENEKLRAQLDECKLSLHSAKGGTIYHCSVCGKNFTTSEELRQHKHSTAPPAAPTLTCQFCGKKLDGSSPEGIYQEKPAHYACWTAAGHFEGENNEMYEKYNPTVPAPDAPVPEQDWEGIAASVAENRDAAAKSHITKIERQLENRISILANTKAELKRTRRELDNQYHQNEILEDWIARARVIWSKNGWYCINNASSRDKMDELVKENPIHDTDLKREKGDE